MLVSLFGLSTSPSHGGSHVKARTHAASRVGRLAQCRFLCSAALVAIVVGAGCESSSGGPQEETVGTTEDEASTSAASGDTSDGSSGFGEASTSTGACGLGCGETGETGEDGSGTDDITTTGPDEVECRGIDEGCSSDHICNRGVCEPLPEIPSCDAFGLVGGEPVALPTDDDVVSMNFIEGPGEGQHQMVVGSRGGGWFWDGASLTAIPETGGRRVDSATSANLDDDPEPELILGVSIPFDQGQIWIYPSADEFSEWWTLPNSVEVPDVDILEHAGGVDILALNQAHELIRVRFDSGGTSIGSIAKEIQRIEPLEVEALGGRGLMLETTFENADFLAADLVLHPSYGSGTPRVLATGAFSIPGGDQAVWAEDKPTGTRLSWTSDGLEVTTMAWMLGRMQDAVMVDLDGDGVEEWVGMTQTQIAVVGFDAQGEMCVSRTSHGGVDRLAGGPLDDTGLLVTSDGNSIRAWVVDA